MGGGKWGQATTQPTKANLINATLILSVNGDPIFEAGKSTSWDDIERESSDKIQKVLGDKTR